MFEKMSQSAGNILGYEAKGMIRKEDYAALTTDVEALLQQEDSIRLLLDLEGFEGEEIKAWGADWKFGREYKKEIAKAAVVGDKKRQKYMTSLLDAFMPNEVKFFSTGEREAAWEWLKA